MPGRTQILLFFLALTLGSPLANAQSVEEQAEELNIAGRRLFGEQKFEEALTKFRQAVVLAPLGKYYFNICFTLSQLERYRDAIIACEAVEPNGADEQLLSKTNSMLASLRERTGDQDSGPQPPPPPDQGQPADPSDPAGQPPPGAPPPTTAEPEGYIWGLGVRLGGVNNVSIGGTQADGTDQFDKSGGQVGIFADLMLNRTRGLAGRVALSYSHIPTSDPSFGDFSFIDIGASALWHIPLSDRFLLTPSLGVLISLQGPTDTPQALFAFGAQLGASVDWIVDQRRRHALSLYTMATAYSAARGSVGDDEPAVFGLDNGGAMIAIGLGYTLRFDTPFGQLPIFTLE